MTIKALLALNAAALASAWPLAASAQVPDDMAAVELRRSGECVDVLARLETLDASLAPLANRSQRLMAIGQAVALEEDAVVDSLDTANPVEAAVRAWFEADAALAARHVAQPSPALQEERAAARAAIKATVTEALRAVQVEADAAIAATGDLQQRSGRCAGAVLVRSAVLESCGARTTPLCAAARDSATVNPTYRFVDTAEGLWDVQELRAWTTPGPLALAVTGQLGGARTVGATRMGNVAVTVAFAPWLQERADLSEETAERLTELTDSLGFGGAHPEVIFVPSLAIRATLPEALGGETSYLFHFGTPEQADVVWGGSANTGASVEGIVALAASHLVRLQAGEPLTMTAIHEAEDGQPEALYAIELTALNQAPAVRGLLRYMATQLPADLARLVPPGNP